MAQLSPCPSCTRHVRAGDATCPFCGGNVPAVAPRAAPLGRPTRAALMFAGAAIVGVATAAGACSSSSGTSTDKDGSVTKEGGEDDGSFRSDSIVAAYGAPFDGHFVEETSTGSDAGSGDAASGSEAGSNDAAFGTDSIVAAYGAPFIDAHFGDAEGDAADGSTIVAAYGAPGSGFGGH